MSVDFKLTKSNDTHIDNVVNVGKRHDKNSCWNLVDPEWMESAYKFSFSDSFYVHFELLVWIVNFIDSEVLQNDWDLRCTIEEVFHHNLDGQVYCVRFYRRLGNTSFASIFKRSYYVAITDLIEKLRYKIIWKPKPTYFLWIDSDINETKVLLMKKLQKLNLLQFLENTYTETVNWMYIENIEIYEFSATLTEQQINAIENIIINQPIIESKPSLYIVKEFVWHKLQGEFIDIDTLALDICTEEWCRYKLLDNFSINEIIEIDMANKDYRDPYYDEYLDKYLKRLLSKWYPDLLTDKKFDYILPDRNDKLLQYFLNQFRNKISALFIVHEKEKIYFTKYNIPFITPSHNLITLKGDNPNFDVLSTTLPKYGSITFIITNYAHFTDPMFQYLLNNLNREQIFAFDFENEFVFEVPDLILPIQSRVIQNQKRKIAIRIEKCNIKNSVKLDRFVKYLMELFKDAATHEYIDLWFTLSDCKELEECKSLGDIGEIFKTVAFEFTNLSRAQLNKLSSSLNSRSNIRFHHCNDLNDEVVMQLISNSKMEISNFIIEGISSCSLLLYFNIAEYLMETQDVNSVRGFTFTDLNVQLGPNKSIFNELEFFRNDGLIQIRKKSKTLDPYCILNGIPEDEPPPFDYD